MTELKLGQQVELNKDSEEFIRAQLLAVILDGLPGNMQLGILQIALIECIDSKVQKDKRLQVAKELAATLVTNFTSKQQEP